MKRRREGTLSHVSVTPADGAAWAEALRSISPGGSRTLEGILDGYARLADEQARPEGSLRAETAGRLKGYVAAARSMLKRAPRDLRRDVRTIEEIRADPFPWNVRDLILAGLRIGMLAAELKHEIRDDTRPDSRRRITRTAYLKARARHGTHARIAEALGVSEQALLKWRRANLEE